MTPKRRTTNLFCFFFFFFFYNLMIVWRNELFLKAQVIQYHLILKPIFLRIKRSDFLSLVLHSRYLDVRRLLFKIE